MIIVNWISYIYNLIVYNEWLLYKNVIQFHFRLLWTEHGLMTTHDPCWLFFPEMFICSGHTNNKVIRVELKKKSEIT